MASFGHFSSQFWIDDVTNLCQNFKILTKWFQKRVMNLKVSFSFPCHISINIGKWNLNFDLFDPFLGWQRRHGELKFQNLEPVVSKTNTLSQISFYYWLHLYITMDTWNTNVGHFWLIFWLMNSPRESKLAKFWENDLRNKLFISKFHQYLFPSSYHLPYMI